jgi:hypothetical protein
MTVLLYSQVFDKLNLLEKYRAAFKRKIKKLYLDKTDKHLK